MSGIDEEGGGSSGTDLADPRRYIEERAKSYQKWYDGKSRTCKARYLWMRGLTVVGGAIVPVLVNFDFDGVDYLTTFVSLLVVTLVALEGVLHYREQWKNYRSTEQYLGHELVYYETRAGAYRNLNDGDAFLFLVDRVESAIASENAATLNTMTLAQQVTEEQVKGGPDSGLSESVT
jgi:hypothetical protein